VVQVPAGLPLVRVDAEMIRRVLVNLLENALKYTPPSSTITVGAREAAAQSCRGGVELWVQDTGPGLPPEEHERIFEKFARSDRSLAARGLGLGLFFCRLAVEGHGGRIWVESEPGAGACFKFTLPADNP
jgi:two-component system sensor histidine kinase KdpD